MNSRGIKEMKKLKKLGYTESQLKEHFGDVYKVSNILCFLEFLKEEIKINPKLTPYRIWIEYNLYFVNKSDYYIQFDTDKETYILGLLYFPINDISTRNVVFTTKEYFDQYKNKLENIKKEKNVLDEDDMRLLSSIFEKETNINDIIPLMKSISYILVDIFQRNIINEPISIGETNNPQKINFYRNIIKDSFPSWKETKVEDINKNAYFIYD